MHRSGDFALYDHVLQTDLLPTMQVVARKRERRFGYILGVFRPAALVWPLRAAQGRFHFQTDFKAWSGRRRSARTVSESSPQRSGRPCARSSCSRGDWRVLAVGRSARHLTRLGLHCGACGARLCRNFGLGLGRFAWDVGPLYSS